MSRLAIVMSIVACLGLAAVSVSPAADRRAGAKADATLNKVTGLPVATMININRIASWYQANGQGERRPSDGNSGLYYPRGTTTAVYAAGLMWGGKFQDGRTPTQRVNGYSYSSGTKPGKILGGDPATWTENPDAADVRIWRVRRDYVTADLKQDAAEINYKAINDVTDADITRCRDQYRKDWEEWPWQKGAPFYDNGYLGPNGTDTLGASNKVLDWGEDANKNGILDPGEDGNGNGVLDGETPGIADADQVVWTVFNDIGAVPPWNAPESGLEIQFTAWGYSRTDALGNVIFKKWRIIYKGTPVTPTGSVIEDMYLCQWSDVDLGDSGDDFAGCDTVLSLGFVYNGKPVDAQYADFDLKPPASGYDFLQGPKVKAVAGQDLNKNGIDDADSREFAIFDLKRITGYVNLPMTSFIYFAAGGRYEDPPFTQSGGIRWYQMFRGLPPDPLGPPDPDPLTDPVTRQPTAYWLSGDPVAGKGWLDGSIDNPGDRRILLNTGPFTMALGDTQELVCAYVGGLGTSSTGSVSVMKFNDRSVQAAYDALFQLAKAPNPPKVYGTALDREIMLDWETDADAVKKTEEPVYFGGYAFEGYNIYQLPSQSADLSTAVRIATFDIANGITTIFQEQFDPVSGEVVNLPAQLGTDTGIKRIINVTEDKIRGGPLVNGQSYYFAVTAYNYTPDVSKPTRTLECPLTVITVTPQLPPPGTIFSYTPGDTVAAATNVVGVNDASLYPVVYNPERQQGDTYQVKFDTGAGAIKWDLVNTTRQTTLVSGATDLTGTVEYRVTESGFSLYVKDVKRGLKSVTDPSLRNLFGSGTTSSSVGVFGTSEGDLQSISGLGSATNLNYEIRFDGVGSYAVRLPGSGVTIGVRWMPFSVWELGRSPADTPKQMIAAWRDDGVTNKEGWNVRPDTIHEGSVTARPFEAIYITKIAYPNTGTPAGDSAAVANPSVRNSVFQAASSQTNQNCAVFGAFVARIDGSTDVPASGTNIVFNKNLEVRAGDVKEFRPAPVTREDPTASRAAVEQIRAFPNPYYGVNQMETSSAARFITFSHLPYYAKIRIFNLAGTLVRTLDKAGSDQFFRWDLQNYNGLPVASGIYIAYIELKDSRNEDLGTKILKLAIIQEQQFLPYY